MERNGGPIWTWATPGWTSEKRSWRRKEVGRIRPDIQWHVATKRGKIKALTEGPYKELIALVERKKALIRALVEHPLHVIKKPFHYKKVSYRGLKKNEVRLHARFAMVNLVLTKRELMDGQLGGVNAS